MIAPRASCSLGGRRRARAMTLSRSFAIGLSIPNISTECDARYRRRLQWSCCTVSVDA
jgi:hypothetical protein